MGSCWNGLWMRNWIFSPAIGEGLIGECDDVTTFHNMCAVKCLLTPGQRCHSYFVDSICSKVPVQYLFSSRSILVFGIGLTNTWLPGPWDGIVNFDTVFSSCWRSIGQWFLPFKLGYQAQYWCCGANTNTVWNIVTVLPWDTLLEVGHVGIKVVDTILGMVLSTNTSLPTKLYSIVFLTLYQLFPIQYQ